MSLEDRFLGMVEGTGLWIVERWAGNIECSFNITTEGIGLTS